jgi:hypothetical protein
MEFLGGFVGVAQDTKIFRQDGRGHLNPSAQNTLLCRRAIVSHFRLHPDPSVYLLPQPFLL